MKVAPLEHKPVKKCNSWSDEEECQPVDDSVENGAPVVEPLLLLLPSAEHPEVLSRPRDHVGKELDHNSADVLV